MSAPVRSRTSRIVLAILALALFAAFIALGTWQVQRRSWKLDLIAQVDQRLDATATAAPDRAQWPAIEREHDEYRKLFIDGVLLNADETFVQAVTAQGPGFWLMTPLRAEDGSIVLINRGFVDAAHRDPATRRAAQTDAPVHIGGLLRLSEPDGAFLHHNNPGAQRWYSRDVAAIAAAHGLPGTDVAPYFIDADATPNPGGWPIGGLTIVRFHNSHFVYAVTWYALALMTACAMFFVGREEWLRRRRH